MTLFAMKTTAAAVLERFRFLRKRGNTPAVCFYAIPHAKPLRTFAEIALIGLATAGLSSNAWAGIEDYEFQLVQPEIKEGIAAEIAVRLVDKRSGKPVPDAVIFAQRVDMAPDGMEMMAAPIEVLPSTEPGVYRFKAQISMAGGWRLSLGAKVQGETGTLENKLVLKAIP